MSKFYDTADLIVTHLKTVSALSSVDIVADRQMDIAAELRKAIAKQIGGLAVVTWIGSPNEDLSADGPRFLSKFTVTLFTKPVLRAGDTPADDMAEAIATALHDYRFAANSHYSSRLVCTGIDPIQADELLAYRINLSTPIQL